MTPKEKAGDLFYKFSMENQYYERAKQCALIAVDEIMKAVGWEEMELGVDRDNYWQEVKQEIETFGENKQ
jgi:hypothetical protein